MINLSTRLKRSIYLITFSSFIFLHLSCLKRVIDEPTEKILAKVGSRTISVNEFIRRAEYTIRPPYCRSDYYIHRKIIFNSLIAEKLLALEAGNDNELVRNKEFQAYIRGRKEQAMRQFHYYNEAYDKVELDTNEIKKVYKVAGRKYRISYAVLPDTESASTIHRLIVKENVPFDEVLNGIFLGSKIPQKEISFTDVEEAGIHESLFSEKLKKGQIIGPIQTEDKHYLIVKIEGWTENLAISNSDIEKRWHDVCVKLKEPKARKVYTDYVQNLMKGKKIEFNEGTFYQLSELLAPIYVRTEKDKKDSFSSKIWGKEIEFEYDRDIGENIDKIRDEAFFEIDGKVWKVEDFENALKSHPLVFRKRRFSESEFPEQLKLAVVDLIRDHYITKEAYKKGYDKVNVVKRNNDMWKDNLVALYQRNRYLGLRQFNGNFNKDYINGINEYLNPYIDSLQIKYSDVIKIDTDEFDKIELTRIDMVAIQQNLPYPIAVPNFPLITTDDKLDYGKKMIEESY